MPQMNALDAQFLNFETTTNVANIGGLAILDPSTAPGGVLSRDRVLSLLRQRMHLARPLRRKLVQVPLGLDYPYWIEDPDPDLDYHVREIALPPPGDDRQLAEQVARLHARLLDRRRPLWEMYLIHGMAGGEMAIYTKMHHAAIDGISGAEVLAALLDTSPEPAKIPPEGSRDLDALPGTWEMIGRGLGKALTNPIYALRFAVNAMPRLDEIPLVSQLPGARAVSQLIRGLARRLSGERQIPDLPQMKAPPTPFSGQISAHRRFAFGRLPLEDVKQIKNVFGITVNDVIMVLCASAVRSWLIDHHALPGLPLVAGVPISLRIGHEGAAEGNQVTLMTAPLATNVADVGERVEVTRRAMNLLKERFSPVPARWLREFSEMMPAALAGLADRAAFAIVGQAAPPINLVVSNIPGPQVPLYMGGARLIAHHPVSVITDVSGGINITIFSYNGSLDVGVVACREMMPDAWAVIGYLHQALDELKALASVP